MRSTLTAEFANSLCLHPTVITSDRKVLLTKRSEKVGKYAPGSWSASIEEHLEKSDIETADPSGIMAAFGARALEQELGLFPDSYDPTNFRVVSLFLEGDCLNIGVCAMVHLKYDSVQLESILRGTSRADHEFSDLEFLPLERSTLLKELVRPRRKYHPTSQYRLLYTFLHHFGGRLDRSDLPAMRGLS